MSVTGGGNRVYWKGNCPRVNVLDEAVLSCDKNEAKLEDYNARNKCRSYSRPNRFVFLGNFFYAQVVFPSISIIISLEHRAARKLF